MWSSYYSQQQWETFLWDWYSVHVDKHPTNGGYKLVLMGQLLPSDCYMEHGGICISEL